MTVFRCPWPNACCDLREATRTDGGLPAAVALYGAGAAIVLTGIYILLEARRHQKEVVSLGYSHRDTGFS